MWYNFFLAEMNLITVSSKFEKSTKRRWPNFSPTLLCVYDELEHYVGIYSFIAVIRTFEVLITSSSESVRQVLVNYSSVNEFNYRKQLT